MRYSTLVVPSLLVASAAADFTFNTTFQSGSNGQISSPWSQLRAEGATTDCLNAYAMNIDCDPTLFNLSLTPSTTPYNNSVLQQVCSSSTCESSLAGFLLNLFEKCQNQPKTVTTFSSASPESLMLRYYRAFCTKDLNNGTFCLTEQNPVTLDISDTNKADIAAACKDTCFTQNSAVQWQVYTGLNMTDNVSVADVSKVCPDVDASNYEVVAPLSVIAARSSSSSSTTSSTATTAAATSTTATSAASTTAKPSTTTVSASTQTNSAGSAATTTSKPSSANAIVRGVMPVAWAALAMAIAISI